MAKAALKALRVPFSAAVLVKIDIRNRTSKRMRIPQV
jgi:hypothetical protein